MRYKQILSGCSFECKSLLNFNCLLMKFHNRGHIIGQEKWISLLTNFSQKRNSLKFALTSFIIIREIQNSLSIQKFIDWYRFTTGWGENWNQCQNFGIRNSSAWTKFYGKSTSASGWALFYSNLGWTLVLHNAYWKIPQ